MNPLIWFVVAATILSGFFSLAGYALRAFRRSALQEYLEDHPGRLENLERHLVPLRLAVSFCRATCQVALAVLLVFVFEGDGPWTIGPAVAAGAVAVALIAIFSIAIAGSWARHAGDRVIVVLYTPLMALRYALFPVVATMQAFDLPVRRLAGVSERPEDESQAARQEILQAATEGAADGNVEHEEVEMIASVIQFGGRQAGEIMTPRTDVFALPVRTAWAKACQEVFHAGHTRVPVYEGDLDNIIGVLYAKDLLRDVEGPPSTDLRGIIRKAFFVPESKPLDDLLREFKARKVHLAVVLDEFGGTAGVVSIEDVLEEIVGEIADEYDLSEPALMHRLDDTSAEVDGRMYIDDLNKTMDISIPEDGDYITAAGMVFSELGYIPRVGETLEKYGARFTVLAADERKINRLKVELLPEDESGGEAGE